MADLTYTLLLVDDEPDVVDALRRVLRRPGYEILGCTHPADALAVLASRPVDLVISDLDMPGMHGLELLRRVRRDHPDTLRMVLTGRASLDSALDAINQGEVQRYLTKPWDKDALRRTVREALERLAEVRLSADAGRKVALREQIFAQLEQRHPGITRVALDDGVVRLDPARIDASWTLPSAGGPLEGLSGVVLDRRFRLDEPIGSGGFGVVYRAVQLSLERLVAVKLLRAGERRDHLERFRVEALSTCRVVHPNAVTVLDAGTDDRGLAYLVMELLTGETLAARLYRGDTLPFREAAAMAADLCAALAVAHDAGVLHRDIKPANVYLHEGPEGRVTKLLDFGIARLLSPRGSFRSLTAKDALVGTPAYLAPERVAHAEVDGRADVYSVGVLLYEALSGVTPFQGATPREVALQQLSVHPRPLGTLDPAVSPELDATVTRLLGKDPARRPTAAEACAALRGLLPGLSADCMRRVSAAAASVTTEPGW